MKLAAIVTPTIYCDMDGVLADFETRVRRITGISKPGDIPTDLMWKHITDGVNGQGFFNQLDVLPDAPQLWAYLKRISETSRNVNISILSATGHTITEQSKREKIEWMNEHFDLSFVTGLHFSISGSQKYKYVQAPTDVLIDDMQRNVDLWTNAGGIGILHTSTENTIEQLKQHGWDLF